MNWKSKLYDSYLTTGMNGGKPVLKNFFLQSKYAAAKLLKHLPKEKDIKIIDLGCGSGSLLYCINKFGYEDVLGVDYSFEQVNLANQAGLHFIQQGNLFDFLNSLEDNSTTVFLLMDVLEHFNREEIFTLLTLIKQKVKVGGKIIVHVPNAEGIFGNRIRYGDLTHEIAFTRLSVNQLFRGTGFGKVTCYEDKPSIHGILSFFRRIIWQLGTIPHRILFAAETGDFYPILSQNMLVIVES